MHAPDEAGATGLQYSALITTVAQTLLATVLGNTVYQPRAVNTPWIQSERM
jgi:hypothetical protein